LLSCPGLTGASGTPRLIRTPSSSLEYWIAPGDDSVWVVRPYAVTTAGIGSVVTDLIFSIAKREVTFFSGTALISFL
jgi:hypothetical protein